VQALSLQAQGFFGILAVHARANCGATLELRFFRTQVRTHATTAILWRESRRAFRTWLCITSSSCAVKNSLGLQA